tara:strand:- start:2179 stop:2883 length:705 start_codon:yes stop_codon:yes gene_type:complete
MSKSIGCIISCYNEEHNIIKLVTNIVELNLDKKINFVLVNNASTDETKKIFKELENKYKDIKFVTNNIDKGWGYGIKFGLKFINTDIVGWTHSDLQYEMKDLSKVLDIINNENLDRNKNFLIKGNRVKRKFFDKFVSFMMQLLCSLILKKNLKEINAQPVFINSEQLKKFNLPDGLEMDLYVYYKCIKNNSKIIRMEVIQHERNYGTSSWNSNFLSKIQLAFKFLKHAIDIKNG